MFTKIRNKWLISILILLYVCIQSYCIQQLTVSYDEDLFALYGVNLLKMEGNKDIIKFDSKLPITALNMIPRAIEQFFNPVLVRHEPATDIRRGRYVSLLASVLLALLIYKWSSQLYGDNAGLFSLTLYLLCPNFLAHGVFVSSDIFACLFMTACFYFTWRFNQSRKTADFLFVCLFVALAQISKFSMVHLLLLAPLLLATGYFLNRNSFLHAKFSWAKIAGLIFIFIAINWLVISSAHLFYGMFIPLNHYQFRSEAFKHLQQMFDGWRLFTLVPLPSAYVESLDMVMYLDKLGAGTPGSSQGAFYILGRSSTHGFWYYYFVSLWFKLPISFLLILAAAVITYFRNRNWHCFLKNEMYLLLPAFYFIIYMSFFYSTQIGIRHIIIILPLLYIYAGFLFQKLTVEWPRYTCYALVGYQFLSVAMYFPHFLPYTNEFIPDKKMAYTKLADTNICYGEGKKFLFQYMHMHPDARYLPEKVGAGKIIMEINEMLNINISTAGKYDWVRGLVPADHIHSQYLIFDVTAAVADSISKVRSKQ